MPSYSPVAAGAVVNTVQAVQTIAGVTSDSASFRTSFKAALQTLLPADSVVNITSVTVVTVRRNVLAIGVSVTYKVASTQPASALTSSLSTGTATLTANLQKTFPAASAMPPTVSVVTTTAPSSSPSNANSGSTIASNNTPLIAGVVGGVGGLLLVLLASYGVYVFHKKKAVLVQTHVSGDENVADSGNALGQAALPEQQNN